jgi:hypothetical protein
MSTNATGNNTENNETGRNITAGGTNITGNMSNQTSTGTTNQTTNMTGQNVSMGENNTMENQTGQNATTGNATTPLQIMETRAFYGHGWIVGDNNNGFLIQFLMLNQKLSSNNTAGNASDASLERSGGILIVGLDDSAQKFALVKKQAMPDVVTFEVMPISTGANNSTTISNTSIGTLTILRVPYSNVSVWHGLLRLDSGSLAGIYHAEIGTKSALITNESQVSSLAQRVNKFPTLQELRNFFQQMVSRISR